MTILENLPFEWLVGIRYTRAGRNSRRNRFISFISLISMAGIALGVAALIIVLSIMNGFQKEVRDRMLSVLPHIEIFSASGSLGEWKVTADEALLDKHVKAVAPYVAAQAMMTRDDIVRGVVVRGIAPEDEIRASDIAAQLKQGKLSDLRPGERNIVIGAELARTMHVTVGDKVTMITSRGKVSVSNAMPLLERFNVVGVFEAGHFEYDSTLVFIHIDDALELFKLSAPSGLRLRVTDMQSAPQVALELSRILTGDVMIRDWSRQNRTWFAAVQTQKRMMFLILALIIAVAAFNLVSTLIMTVTDKQADIAILRTLGASPGAIMRIFTIQGALTGVFGTLIGVAFGVLVSFNIGAIVSFIERLFDVKFLSKDVYIISTLPSDLRWPDVWSIAGVAIVLAFLATLYPSWRAARVRPADALRYE